MREWTPLEGLCPKEIPYRGGIHLENCVHRVYSSLAMKSILVSIVAAAVLVGCGNPEADRALLKAAEKGDIEAVIQHLAAGADVNATGDYGTTSKAPLYYAVSNDHAKIAELLIAGGANVNPTKTTSHPLYAAVSGRAGKETIEVLITNGADINVLVHFGGKNTTPLDEAIRKAQPEIVDFLRKHGAKKASEL